MQFMKELYCKKENLKVKFYRGTGTEENRALKYLQFIQKNNVITITAPDIYCILKSIMQEQQCIK